MTETTAPGRGRTTWTCVALAALAVAVYVAVARNGFVDWDDDDYVYENPVVRRGLTWDGAAWAFSTLHGGNWHPLAWLSHMLDVSLFGVNAGPMHLVSLAFHVANVLLLHAFFLRTTASLGKSACVAALFAVHPMHVESVAWIAERKDVLSAFFVLLGLHAHIARVRRPSAGRRVVVAACFAAALLSKAMAVTFPFLLLLVDFWPLRRAESVKTLVLEKAELFAFSAAACVVAIVGQSSVGAMGATPVPLGVRAANAANSYVVYVAKTFWPTDLAALYPYAPASLGVAALCAAAIVAVTWLALREARRRPWVAVGWLWFVGALVPVVGVVKVGFASTADRFSYVPHVGLFVVLAWGVPELARAWKLGRAAAPTAAVVAVLALALVARRQVDFWKDGVTLWTRAAAVTTGNVNAHVNLGCAALRDGRLDAAEAEFLEALRIDPDCAQAHDDLGLARMRQGRFAEATQEFEAALRAAPGFVDPLVDLGAALDRMGRSEEAVARYREALRLAPDHALARVDLALALGNLRRFDEAITEMREAVRLDPDDAGRHANLARLLLGKGDRAEATRELQTALRLDPTNADARRAAEELR